MRYKCNEIDLHIHTVDSDGKCTCKQIIRKAYEEGIKVFSITDHNFFVYNSEIKKLAEEYNMIMVPGVEFTSFFEGAYFHILVYFDDKHVDKLNNLFIKYNRMKYKKIVGLLKKFKDEKMFVSSEIANELGRLSFRNIAKTLVLEGYANSYDEAMEKYIDNKNFFDCKVGLPIEEVIETIHSIGGIVCLAHPVRSFSDEFSIKNIVDQLVKMGLDGIECYNGKESHDKMDFLRGLVVKYNLVEIGGSDFHGSESEYGFGIQQNIMFDKESYFWEFLLK